MTDAAPWMGSVAVGLDCLDMVWGIIGAVCSEGNCDECVLEWRGDCEELYKTGQLGEGHYLYVYRQRERCAMGKQIL